MSDYTALLRDSYWNGSATVWVADHCDLLVRDNAQQYLAVEGFSPAEGASFETFNNHDIAMTSDALARWRVVTRRILLRRMPEFTASDCVRNPIQRHAVKIGKRASHCFDAYVK